MKTIRTLANWFRDPDWPTLLAWAAAVATWLVPIATQCRTWARCRCGRPAPVFVPPDWAFDLSCPDCAARRKAIVHADPSLN